MRPHGALLTQRCWCRDDCFNIVNGTCSCPGLWQEGGILSYPEFQADVGRATSEMQLLHGNSTAGGVWRRQYSKALVLINTQDGVLDASPSGAGITVSLPSDRAYKDLWGKPVGPTLTLPPVGAAVLLEDSL
eukprot:COSAG03_NODE_347_length_8769_cov_45.065975_4_plen_132_part_00